MQKAVYMAGTTEEKDQLRQATSSDITLGLSVHLQGVSVPYIKLKEQRFILNKLNGRREELRHSIS